MANKFNSLIYSTLMGFWDNSLKILEELEREEFVPNKLLALQLVKDALSMRKKCDNNGAKEVLKQVLTYEKDLNETFLYFVNISYYDTVANSEINKEERISARLSEKNYCEKLRNPILILLSEADISTNYSEQAYIYKKVSASFSKLNDIENAHFSMAVHYQKLAYLSKGWKKKAEKYKKASNEFKKAGDLLRAHWTRIKYYDLLIRANENHDENEKLLEGFSNEFKQILEEWEKIGDVKSYHEGLAFYYNTLATSKKNLKEKAALYKKASEENEAAGNVVDSLVDMTRFYLFLSRTTEDDKEIRKKAAELYYKLASEFGKKDILKTQHLAMAMYYFLLASSNENIEDQTKFYEKAAEEYEAVGELLKALEVKIECYESIIKATENDDGKYEYRIIVAELYLKLAEENNKRGNLKKYHYCLAEYYKSIVDLREKPEEQAELNEKISHEYQKLSDEYLKTAERYKKNGGLKDYHRNLALSYRLLADSKEKPEEKAELYKKAAEEFETAGILVKAYSVMLEYYNTLTKFVENIEDKYKIYEKIAEVNLILAKELKTAGKQKLQGKALSRYFFYSSLIPKNSNKSERYHVLASKQTRLGWLYTTQIAFNEFKKSKENKLYFLDLTVNFYKEYLRSKNEQFPTSKVYLCGDINEQLKEKIIKETGDYFDFITTSYPRREFKNSKKFKAELEESDFILMIVEETIDYELTYELGLASGIGKPTIVLVLNETQIEDSFIKRIVTLISDTSSAFTILKMLSLIKSGESLEIEDQDEKSTISRLLKDLRKKPSFFSQLEDCKLNSNLARGEKCA